MTSKNESNRKFFFSFISIIGSVIHGLSFLSVTPRKGIITIMCSGFVTRR